MDPSARVTKAVINQPSRSSSANEKPAKPARNSQQICNLGDMVLVGHGFADQWFSAPLAVARQARAEDAAGTCAQPATSIGYASRGLPTSSHRLSPAKRRARLSP